MQSCVAKRLKVFPTLEQHQQLRQKSDSALRMVTTKAYCTQSDFGDVIGTTVADIHGRVHQAAVSVKCNFLNCTPKSFKVLLCKNEFVYNLVVT